MASKASPATLNRASGVFVVLPGACKRCMGTLLSRGQDDDDSSGNTRARRGMVWKMNAVQKVEHVLVEEVPLKM